MYAQYWITWKYLLLTDLQVFKGVIHDKLINLCIWVISNIGIFTYVLPAFGLKEDYGPFLFAGLCASAGLFEVFPSVAAMVSDIKGNQVILYQCTLPIPSWLVLLRLIVYNAIGACILGLSVIPVGKLVLWNKFSLLTINWAQLLLILPLMSLFFGSYTIFIASRVNNMEKIGNTWMRFVYPIWFMGGFQFSWYSLRNVAPALAYVNLANPIVYIMEGTRAAILGQTGFLNFWLCVGMLIFFCIITAWLGITTLKRKLDLL